MTDPISLLLEKLLAAETFVEAREAGTELQAEIHDHIQRLRTKLGSLELDIISNRKKNRKLKRKSRHGS